MKHEKCVYLSSYACRTTGWKQFNKLSRISFSSPNTFWESTMAPKSKTRNAPHSPFAFCIEEPFPDQVNGHTYIPEPSMENEKRKIWYSDVLISYPILGINYAFKGLLLRRVKKSTIWNVSFPATQDALGFLWLILWL